MDNNTLFEILEKPLELAEYERVMKKSEIQILTKIQRIKDNVVIFKKFYNIFWRVFVFYSNLYPKAKPPSSSWYVSPYVNLGLCTFLTFLFTFQLL